MDGQMTSKYDSWVWLPISGSLWDGRAQILMKALETGLLCGVALVHVLADSQEKLTHVPPFTFDTPPYILCI